MKKVLRYELDDFLYYINDNDSVFDNESDKYVECNTVFVIDGEYKVLLNNYICDAVYTDGQVVAFRDGSIYLDPMYHDIEKRCTAYNDKLYALGAVSGFIDEIYVLGAAEPVESPQHSAKLEDIVKRLNVENLSPMEKVELLMDNYEEDGNHLFR